MMNKLMITGLILALVIASSLLIGYSQNWFQTQPDPTVPDTNNPQPTTQPTTVASLNIALEIYGNANMDAVIDSADVTALQQMISGSREVTEFADANCDGVIDDADIEQVNAIITGQASKIYMLDGSKEKISINLPAERIIVEYNQNTELVRILGIEDLVVGVDSGVEPVKTLFFPRNADTITNVGSMSSPDYEKILNLNPTTLLVFSPGSGSSATTAQKAANLPGVDVVYLGLYNPNVTNPADSRFLQGILKAGYIFNKVDRATEYANWILNITSEINAKASTIPENQLKTVWLTNSPTLGSTRAYVELDTLGQACVLAGGKNLFQAPLDSTAFSINPDTETILSQDPDYIFLHTVRYTYGGGTNEPAQGIDCNDPTEMDLVLQEFLATPAYANLAAVQNKHVYLIAGDFRNNAMGGTLGAVYMARILYPDVFTDLNPQSIHQEYITKYLRLDNYNLDTIGVYLYPPITINGDTVGIPNGTN